MNFIHFQAFGHCENVIFISCVKNQKEYREAFEKIWDFSEPSNNQIVQPIRRSLNFRRRNKRLQRNRNRFLGPIIISLYKLANMIERLPDASNLIHFFTLVDQGSYYN